MELQQQRLTEWEEKRARRRAEFAARIPVRAAQVASEVTAAVASEVKAAVAAALQAAFAGYHKDLDLAPTTASTPTASVADDHDLNLAPATTATTAGSVAANYKPPASTVLGNDPYMVASNGIDLAAPTPTTCSTTCPSRAATTSVSSATPTSPTTTGIVDPEPVAAISTSTDPEPVAATEVLLDSTPDSAPAATATDETDLRSVAPTNCSAICPGGDTSADIALGPRAPTPATTEPAASAVLEADFFMVLSTTSYAECLDSPADKQLLVTLSESKAAGMCSGPGCATTHSSCLLPWDPGGFHSCAWNCQWQMALVNYKGRLGAVHSIEPWSPLNVPFLLACAIQPEFLHRYSVTAVVSRLLILVVMSNEAVLWPIFQFATGNTILVQPWDPGVLLYGMYTKFLVELRHRCMESRPSWGIIVLVTIVARTASGICHGTVMLGRETGKESPFLQYSGGLHEDIYWSLHHHNGYHILKYYLSHLPTLHNMLNCMSAPPNLQILELRGLPWQYSSNNKFLSESFPCYNGWLQVRSSCIGSDYDESGNLNGMRKLFGCRDELISIFSLSFCSISFKPTKGALTFQPIEVNCSFLVSYYLTGAHIQWGFELLQWKHAWLHLLFVWSWVQSSPTGNVFLHGFGSEQFLWEVAWSIDLDFIVVDNKLRLAVPWDPGLRQNVTARGVFLDQVPISHSYYNGLTYYFGKVCIFLCWSAGFQWKVPWLFYHHYCLNAFLDKIHFDHLKDYLDFDQVRVNKDYYLDDAIVFNLDRFYLDTFLGQVCIGHDYYLGVFLEQVRVICYLNLVKVCLDFGIRRNLVEVTKLQVPWDPGGSTRHRLAGKPHSKEGGMLATSPTFAMGWAVAAPIGLGLL